MGEVAPPLLLPPTCSAISLTAQLEAGSRQLAILAVKTPPKEYAAGSEHGPSGLLASLSEEKQFEIQAAVTKIIDQLSENGWTRMQAATAVADAADDYIMRLSKKLDAPRS